VTAMQPKWVVTSFPVHPIVHVFFAPSDLARSSMLRGLARSSMLRGHKALVRFNKIKIKYQKFKVATTASHC
jgi:hypothetical protein